MAYKHVDHVEANARFTDGCKSILCLQSKEKQHKGGSSARHPLVQARVTAEAGTGCWEASVMSVAETPENPLNSCAASTTWQRSSSRGKQGEVPWL